MDKVIRHLTSEPLSGDQVMRACDNQTRVLTYSDLQSVDNIDQILDPYDNFVLLYETRPGYGHWVCVVRHPESGELEFFCPYGIFIDDHLKYAKEQIPGQDYPHLSELMVESPYKIISNEAKLQKLSDDISSCGRHVALRVNMRSLPLDQYINLLESDGGDIDKTVTYLTAFI